MVYQTGTSTARATLLKTIHDILLMTHRKALAACYSYCMSSQGVPGRFSGTEVLLEHFERLYSRVMNAETLGVYCYLLLLF